LVNICYLANYETFKQHKSIEDYQCGLWKSETSRNFKNAVIQFEKPLTISQVSFEEKNVLKIIYYDCDTAGLIHPLCGNGMAMA
jgi:hypothetical protein